VIFGVEQKTKHEKKYFGCVTSKASQSQKRHLSQSRMAQTSWAIIYVLIM
jgi:hypothetical protein